VRRCVGQHAVWPSAALLLAPMPMARAPRAERQLAERHAVRRCVGQHAVWPSAAQLLARMPAARAPRAVRALREGQALREARELQGQGARRALLLLAYAAVARLRLSPSQQKR
jgi:hypothetical protein